MSNTFIIRFKTYEAFEKARVVLRNEARVGYDVGFSDLTLAFETSTGRMVALGILFAAGIEDFEFID